MTNSLPPLPIVGFVFCSVAFQTLLKAAGLHTAEQAGFWADWFFNPYLWLSLCCLAFSMLLWVRTLRLLPLATAYSWTAFTYVLTPLCGAFFWREHLSLMYFIGLACIVCGVIITTRSAVE